tara:strand:+ start:5248 stop:5463 length:216 start_codon:yes stop_codon:yes gene_type:complete
MRDGRYTFDDNLLTLRTKIYFYVTDNGTGFVNSRECAAAYGHRLSWDECSTAFYNASYWKPRGPRVVATGF